MSWVFHWCRLEFLWVWEAYCLLLQSPLHVNAAHLEGSHSRRYNPFPLHEWAIAKKSSLIEDSKYLLYIVHLSSAAMSAGLSVPQSVSNKVLMFQSASVKDISSFFCTFQLHGGRILSGQCLDHLFYAPPLLEWGVWLLKKAVQSHRGLSKAAGTHFPTANDHK